MVSITDLLVCVCFHHIGSIWQCLHKSTHLAGWLFCKCKTLISCPLSISGGLQENHSWVIIRLFCLFIFNINGTFGCSSLILVAVGIKLVVWWGINFLARLVPSALVGMFLWSNKAIKGSLFTWRALLIYFLVLVCKFEVCFC